MLSKLIWQAVAWQTLALLQREGVLDWKEIETARKFINAAAGRIDQAQAEMPKAVQEQLRNQLAKDATREIPQKVK